MSCKDISCKDISCEDISSKNLTCKDIFHEDPDTGQKTPGTLTQATSMKNSCEVAEQNKW